MFDINSIKMANNFVMQNGVKVLIYGIAGSGKTRFTTTAERPLLWAIENGLLSVKDDNIPAVSLPIKQEIDRVLATYTGGQLKEDPFQCVNEFVDWVINPMNGTEYQTLVIDSLSELSSLVFQFYDAVNKNGQKAYGDMADRMMIWIKKLYYCNKDVIFICKETTRNVGSQENPVYVTEPYFEGQKTKLETLHLMDIVLRFQKKSIVVERRPTVYDVAVAKSTPEFIARDRSGKLPEFMPQHFAQIRAAVLGLNN